MSFINSLFIAIFCKKIGSDCFHNIYYESKAWDYLGRTKRYIIYNSRIDSVPPLWHAWLHYMINEVPGNTYNFIEQQHCLPRVTDTKLLSNSMEHEKIQARYSKWQPLN